MKAVDYIYLLIQLALISLALWMVSSFYPVETWASSLEKVANWPVVQDLLSKVSLPYSGFSISAAHMSYSALLAFLIEKFLYFLVFCLQAFFSFKLICRLAKKEWSAWLLSFLLGIGFASFVELLQAFLPQRTPSWEDFLIHGLAVIAGILIAKIDESRFFKR